MYRQNNQCENVQIKYKIRQPIKGSQCAGMYDFLDN